MGLTFQRVIAESRETERSTNDLWPGFERGQIDESGDWVSLESLSIRPLADFAGELAEVADSRQAHALGLHVEDSDFAYAVAVARRSKPSHLLFGVELAKTLQNGVWALEKCKSQEQDGDWRTEAARRFSRWSKVAPIVVEPSTVIPLLHKDFLFAEQAVEDLLLLLGINFSDVQTDWARFDHAIQTWTRQKLGKGKYEINAPDSRFVIGSGTDFFGIWERSTGGKPIKRYPKDSQGGQDVLRAYLKLEHSVGEPGIGQGFRSMLGHLRRRPSE